MTDSEGKTLSHSWAPEPKPEAQHQASVRERRRHMQALDEITVRMDGEVWQGKGYELACKVRDEIGHAFYEPGRFTAALEQACRRYIQKNGRPFSVKSLREGLRQWDEMRAGRHRSQR